MRWVAACSCVALALVTSACDPSDRAYIREGIGTKLETPGIVEQTLTEDAYLAQLCAQGDCGGRSDYATIVQAGMNDIDRRCDAYLTWLDARRRDKEPILAEIGAIGTTTGAILTATSAGVLPLAIAGQAFGLISASYSNWNSRLLLVVDHSTVQTVVYTRQTDFRNAIANQAVLSRARAVYLLRNYLRICLPITIETDINTSVKLAQMGAGAAVKMNPVVQTARPTVIRDVNAPLRRIVRPTPPPSPTKIGRYEPGMQTPDMRLVLDTLCRPKTEADLGPAGSPARKALAKFLADNGKTSAEALDRNAFIDIQELSEAGKKGC